MSCVLLKSLQSDPQHACKKIWKFILKSSIILLSEAIDSVPLRVEAVEERNRIITIAEPVNGTWSTDYGEISHNFNPQNVSNGSLVIYI